MHNLKNLYRGSLGGHVCLQCRRYATKKTHYEILGVSKTATEKEIKSAYIELSKKYHPDTSGTARSKRKFTEINEAYSVLGKPLSRREYDNEIAFKNAQTSSSNTYGPHSRPPGSGPGGPPPPGYQYRQGYDQQSKYSSDYSSYEEYRRREMEAIRKLRQKMEEDRIRKFREFERNISKMSSVGRRLLNVYLRFLYVSAFFMVIYAATSVVPSHRWGNTDTDRSNDWHSLYRKSRVMQTQMMWSVIILIFQFLVGMMLYLRSNSVGGRTFRHPPTPEEVKEFYRRMGYNFGQEDSNPNYKSNRGSSEGVEVLFRMFFVQLALVMFIVYMALRYMVISKALQTQRALHSQRLEHERRDDSELRQRFYHFYGKDGQENRRRAREASYKEWSKEENQREFRRLTAGLMLFALFMTIAKAFASGQMEVPSNTQETGSPVTIVLLGLFCLICLSTTFVYKNTSWRLVNVKKLDIRRKELNRSPSDELKAQIEQKYDLEKNVKDITPPTS